MTRGAAILRILVGFTLLFMSSGVIPVNAADFIDPEVLLQSMTPEEKVGQLFLVTFDGTEVGQESEIYNLINRYHVGGVVLLTENNNFTDSDTILNARQMILALQQIEWDSALGENQDSANSDNNAYIPLLIGLNQIGDGYPGDQILTGLTQLPSQMAIGATWDLSLAFQVGELAGKELSTLGINLYLGPNLDVLENTNSQAADSIGVNTYGGNPFWVGEMGKSFISGMHIGSENRMLVVAQNFPGTGNSDRSSDLEVSTVRKSLEQLSQTEFAPYFTVTSPEPGDPGRVDGVMVSHIRYQGIQGNIRSTTRPISFDSNAMQQLMSLPEFETWRQSGGLIFTDDLGSGSLQRFFDPNETNFDASQVARNAFLAGNDILYADDFISSGDPDSFTTLVSTIEFFVQKYREDPAFAQRVDSSVERILAAKLAIYDENFTLQNVNRTVMDLDALGQSQQVTFDVAQNAVTLIDPAVQDLESVLPSTPIRYEDIVIFTDVRRVVQCDRCSPTTNVSAIGLASALESIYGPEASNQISPQSLNSYTFTHLEEYLENVENETTETLDENLRVADWVIFNTLDINPQYPESRVLERILQERLDLVSGKNVIVFAMGSPIYLDATNISKVTAYYALYSKSAPFLEVAARVLMKEIAPSGALPVSLGSIGYDLSTQTSPSPNQVIGLDLVLPPKPEAEGTATPEQTQTPEPTTLPSFNIGDTLTVKTTQIFDRNNHVVPDGTIVRFNFRISGEPGITQQFETVTEDGVAYFNYRIEAAGGLEITATSEPALQSELLQINISPEGVTSIIQISPTPIITNTSTATPSVTPTFIPTTTPTPEPEPQQFPTLGEWALGVMIMGVGSVLAFLVGYFWWGKTHWGLRGALCSLIGGLLAYSILNLGFDSTKYWLSQSGRSFVVEITIVGLLFGWIVAFVWWLFTEGRYPKKR